MQAYAWDHVFNDRQAKAPKSGIKYLSFCQSLWRDCCKFYIYGLLSWGGKAFYYCDKVHTP